MVRTGFTLNVVSVLLLLAASLSVIKWVFG